MQTEFRYKKNKRILILIALIYKIILEVSFWKVLTVDYSFYEFHFDILKYLNGFFWVVLALGLVNYKKQLASTFLLYFLIVLQIIPIAAIYALTDNNSPLFFNALCACFSLCEYLVAHYTVSYPSVRSKVVSKYMVPFFLLISIYVLAMIYIRNGPPSLIALDVYSVYELRRNSTLVIGKIEEYLMSGVVTVFLPISMIKAINYKKKWIIALSAFCILTLYLYTGHKTYLFSIALCLIGAIFVKRDNSFYKFFKYFLLGLCALSILAMVLPGVNNIAVKVYSLLVRRALFTPAELKFIHYDYFCNHPRLLLAGMLPIKINPLLPDYYINTRYTLEIGSIYYDSPMMSADTGFFVEGFSRFGFLGLLFSFIILWVILKQIDLFQERNGYVTAVSFFIYPIYALAEQQIFGTLFFGTWFFLLIILNHYDDRFGHMIDKQVKNKRRHIFGVRLKDRKEGQ